MLLVLVIAIVFLIGLLAGLLVFLTVLVSRISGVLTTTAERFIEYARATPGFTTDVVGAAMVMAAHALCEGLGHPLPTTLLPPQTDRVSGWKPLTAGDIVAKKIDVSEPKTP